MEFGTNRSFCRRQFLCGCCVGTFIGFVPAISQAADEIVPVRLEPHHHERFKNEYLRVIEVIIEPGDTTLFHRHELDIAAAILAGADLKNEIPDNPQATILHSKTKDVGFAGYQEQPYVHRVTNIGLSTFRIIAFEIVLPEPGQFDSSNRSEAPAYISELDNKRLHVWRLKLDPGQIAPAIAHSGPSLRVVLGGDQITETTAASPQRDFPVRPGAFEWQPAGPRSALDNTGQSALELVEFELK
ncbi:MAG: hypothetical protein JOZ58_00165 [Acetobacteraceae bacterium]|nr:hypothetical protein [Acetobacteraceae bacterium]